ncbi:MAG: hypothetical protein JWQ38_542 [Flavipsychrobacter sp.]|nr:hypothetical protein [Flavipsychrobacter sp.]
MKTNPQFTLPIERKKSLIEFINNLSNKRLLILWLGTYLFPVLIITAIEYYNNPDAHMLSNGNCGFWDLTYFNFISVLTIGYGDYAPIGFFRLCTIIEAVIGAALYGFTISIITIKFLLPKRNTVVFSEYAYYCTDDNCFMVIYLNTASQYLTNVATSWYFKLDEDWETQDQINVPFITKSVQTFYLDFPLDLDTIKSRLHELDCLRVGLSGSLGMASYSTFVQYNLSNILIIKNRKELTNYRGFYDVDNNLRNDKFKEMFHYNPTDAEFMSKYAQKMKQ